MALVGEDDGIVGDILEERGRRLAGLAAREVARIILDAGTGAGRVHHLEIEGAALLQALGLQQLALRHELVEPGAQFGADRLDRLLQRRARGHIVRVGIDPDALQRVGARPGQRIELVDRFQLLAEERETPGPVLHVRGPELQRIAAHAERAAGEALVVAAILLLDEMRDHLALVVGLPGHQILGHRAIGLDRADAVDARDRGDDDHVVALQKRPGGRMPHPVDLLVDLAFLLDIGVGARDIGLGLVIIVVGNEILDRILRKEGLELAIELRRQRLVRGEDDRRPLRRLDDLRSGKGLAGARGAQQHLIPLAREHPLDELGDRGGLVARGLEFGAQHETLPALELGTGERFGDEQGLCHGHLELPVPSPLTWGISAIPARQHRAAQSARERPSTPGTPCKVQRPKRTLMY